MANARHFPRRQNRRVMENYESVPMLGMFPVKPKHEPETLEKQKRIEKLLLPVVEQIVNVRADV